MHSLDSAKHEEARMYKSTFVSSGITFGSALVTISWSVNKSVFWAIVHGLFSWFYVIYYLIVR